MSARKELSDLILLRFAALVLAVVAAAVVAFLVNVWWVTVLAVLVLCALTAVAVLLVLHYTGAPDWLGPSDEAQLEDAGLVEAETGLPSRARWHELQAAHDADQVSRSGLVTVPRAWQGPQGAYRVLLVTTVPVSADALRATLPDVQQRDLAVLVVVPTLADTAERFRLGDATEAVEHAQAVAQQTVAALAAANIQASGHIGPADPAMALSDGLRTYDAQLVIAVRRVENGRYLEDTPLEPAAIAFGVPFTETTADRLPS
jgi:hypothetical protein